MKDSAVIKGIAIFLAVLSLVMMEVSGLCILIGVEENWYDKSWSLVERSLERNAYALCHNMVQDYVQGAYSEKNNLFLEEMSNNHMFYTEMPDVEEGVDYGYVIQTRAGAVLAGKQETQDVVLSHTEELSGLYFWSERYDEETLLIRREYGVNSGTSSIETVDEYMERSDCDVYGNYSDDFGRANIIFGKRSGTYSVTVYFLEPIVEKIVEPHSLIVTLYQCRYAAIWMLFASLLVLIVSGVYLLLAVNHKKSADELRANGLNRMPLDLYGGICLILSLYSYIIVADSVLNSLGRYADLYRISTMLLLAIGFIGMMACNLFVICWVLALAAQLKQGKGFWWRNSVIGRILLLTRKWWRSIAKKALQWWGLVPIMWHWLVAGVAILLMLVWGFGVESGSFVFLTVLIAAGLIVYNGIGYGKLLQGVKRMSQGDLEEKVELGRFEGQYRLFAEHLNSMADAAMQAARKQMSSERMRTELITNVSHDIKTPLTSIVNYVDLLQKPHTPEEGAHYLEVLARQAQRMKKLVEDLVEMSKANTGNMPVAVTEMDAAEALNQALGEFSAKLEKASLEVVLRGAQEPMPVLADGRLVWRVLSNLLGNVVKYAMPGTRLYIDLQRVGNRVLISLKNISQDSLNVSAEELMERFVRGDASRNTEGSGLGLNIARSLMELQHGALDLVVDGDLFKATLSFVAGEGGL